jgi:hypothetical protein
MPHQKITQALVDALPFQDDTVWYHDTDLPGFNLAVGKTAKTFYAAGEHKRRFIRVKIGRADITQVNKARAVAATFLVRARSFRNGKGPQFPVAPASSYAPDCSVWHVVVDRVLVVDRILGVRAYGLRRPAALLQLFTLDGRHRGRRLRC